MSPPGNEEGPGHPSEAEPNPEQDTHTTGHRQESQQDKDNPDGGPGGNGEVLDGGGPQPWHGRRIIDKHGTPEPLAPTSWRKTLADAGLIEPKRDVRPPPPGWNADPNDVPPGVDYWEWRLYACGLGPDPREKGRRNGPVSTPAGGLGPRAQAALQGEFYTLSTTASGARNDQLNTSAFNLGQIVGAGFLPEALVEEQLTLACHTNGLIADDGPRSVEASLQSGLQAGKLQPRDWDGDDYDNPITEMPASEFNSGAGEPDGDQQAKPPEPPVYAAHILTRSALRELPDPEPLIDNVLDQGTIALLYGRWGTAKSFIALDWAASVATGRKWQGRHVEQRRALYVAGEGAFGFKGRVDAWEVGWHTQIGDGDFAVLPFPVNLTRAVDVANLAALISWGGYSYVVLDTLARCMVGADENSAKDCGVVVDTMVRLLGCTPGGRGVVQGVHHAGKDGKTLRGSSAFEGAADTVYFSSRDGAVITLDREKRKDGPELDRHQFVIDPIVGTNSAVISVHRGGGQTDRGQRLLSTFVHHFSGTGATKGELRLVSDMAQGSFYRALSDLLESGDLVNTGTDKRPFYTVRSE